MFALEGFYNANESVTPSQFKTFVTPLIEQNIGIQALEWVPLVKLADRQAHESSMHTLGYPDFLVVEKDGTGQLVPVQERVNYYPVTYAEPFESNRLAHGFDLNSNETRRQSLIFSRDTGELSATAKVKLLQEAGSSFSFLVFAPVYDLSAERSAVLERKSAIKGFVLGVFRIETLIDNALKRIDASKIQLSLYDVTREERDFLYGEETVVTNDQERFSVRKGLSLPQCQWELVITPTQLALQKLKDNDASK